MCLSPHNLVDILLKPFRTRTYVVYHFYVLIGLQCNDRSMIHWICGVKPKDGSPSSVFLTKLEIPDVGTLLQSRRLRWCGHVRRSSMCIKDVLELPLLGGRFRGRPAKT